MPFRRLYPPAARQSNDGTPVTVLPASAQPAPRPWRRKLLPWLALGMFCALFAAADRAVELDRRRQIAADAEHKTKYGELVDTLSPYLAEPKEVVRDKFNGGRPFLVEEPLDHAYGTLMDAGNINSRYAGWTVNMCYRRGNLYGFELIERNYPHYHGPSNAWVQMERARQALLVLAAGVWGVAVFTLPFARRWRRPIAQVCLGAVVVASAAWCVYPYRAWDHAGLVAPLPLAIAGAGFVTFVLFLWPAGPATTASAWRACQGCGYDLTGNESGVCPECGRPTPKLLVDRWRDEAGRIEAVGADAGPPEREVEDDERAGPDIGAGLYLATEGAEVVTADTSADAEATTEPAAAHSPG